ncbi:MULTISPECIES: oligosaccharide repeat unit polymerase [Cyanophyceae]|uniref:oligosaccharide repeat unit polymerase n=1 Tax=Cyanophyceae TaxID=3028117 RepID=UPI00168873A7|nr:oligosaccharide repeat unit polymerase [Trichocoleus sp. FACHB-69]MBD1933408.1 oligosaccharide repeat unit polymerase [Trichocoleus sp. FACHB-69]
MDTIRIPLRFFCLFVFAVIGSVGLIATKLLTNISSDLLESGLVAWLTLLITGVVVCLYPHLFNISTFRIPGIFISAYSLMVLLPLPFVYAAHPSTTQNTFLFATNISFILTLAGIILTHYWFPSSAKDVDNWISKPIRLPRQLQMSSIVLLVICFIILVLYLKQVGRLPIIDAIIGGQTTLELTLARENALKLIPGRIRYVYGALRDVLFPYTTLLLLVLAMRLRGWWWKIFFVVSLLGSIFYAGSTLEKSPVAALTIMLAYAWLLIRGRTLSVSKLLFIILIALAFPVFVIFAVYQFNIEGLLVVNAIVNRIFYVPAQVIFYYFDYFPKHQSFLLGHTLPYINKFITDIPFPVANTICLYMHPDAMSSCTSNVAYPGYLWADFGWSGIVIGSIICGISLQGLQVLILRLPKSAPTVVLQSMLSYQMILLTSTSFTDFLAPLGTGLEIVLTVLLVPLAVRVKINLAEFKEKRLS